MHGLSGHGIATCLLLLLLVSASASADVLDARTLIERAHAAAGGEVWRRPHSLHMRGTAVLYDEQGQRPPTQVDHYQMWRVYPDWNQDARSASGKVRIDAFRGGQVLFQIAYDGETTWNQDGIIPGAQASEEWSEAFGFGIIRFALDPGFVLTRLADDQVEGHSCAVVRVSDPSGNQTLFWLDSSSYAIRQVGFDTPRGWHQRIYSEFYRVDPPGWQQPGRVRLYYRGALTNDIRWPYTRVNEKLDDALFAPPEAGDANRESLAN